MLWLRPNRTGIPGRYGSIRPTAADVMLLIEVSDSSLKSELLEKADIYPESEVAEYGVVDIPDRRIHVMTDVAEGRYRRIETCTPPTPLALRCKSDAELNTADLFDVK